MKRVIDGKLYDTNKAVLVASDYYFNGRGWDRRGRNTYLYKTKNAFFVVRETMWDGERDVLYPVPDDEARKLYYELPIQEIEFEKAFDVPPQQA